MTALGGCAEGGEPRATVRITCRLDQGVKNVKGAATRWEQGRAAIEQAGGRIIGLWWTQGQYDAVSVIEWPKMTNRPARPPRPSTAGTSWLPALARVCCSTRPFR